MEAKQNRIYLGDGVYVHFDGTYFVLETLLESGMQRICLEPDMIESLSKYADAIARLIQLQRACE